MLRIAGRQAVSSLSSPHTSMATVHQKKYSRSLAAFAVRHTTLVMVGNSYTLTSSRPSYEIKYAIPLGQFFLPLPASRWICGTTPFDGLLFLASFRPLNAEFHQPTFFMPLISFSRC